MTDLTCRDVADFLMAYLDHELGPDQRAEFEAHLDACDDCVVYLRTYEDTVRLGKHAFANPDDPAEEVPEALLQAIKAARGKG